MRKEVFLLLGSNLGDREKNLLLAIKKIIETVGLVRKVSSLYATQPWGVSDQPEFLNQVIEIETDFPPRELLQKLLHIESVIGRRKTTRWGPREIDLDILFYGNLVLSEKDLTIPHPGTPGRRFALVPLCEIAPRFVHPELHKRCDQLLAECVDTLVVKTYTPTDS